MWMTFKTTVRTLLHTPSAIVWTLIFPIVLATVFNFMFEPLRSGAAVEAVDVAVVDDEAWRESPFADVVTALANADEPLLAVHSVDARAARQRGGHRGISGRARSCSRRRHQLHNAAARHPRSAKLEQRCRVRRQPFHCRSRCHKLSAKPGPH